MLLLSCFILSLSSCNQGSSKTKSYASAEEALKGYSFFLHSLKSNTDKSFKELISLTLDFKALDDSVIMGIVRDSLSDIKIVGSRYWLIRDSIGEGLIEKVDLKRRTLKDYYELMMALTKVSKDSSLLKFKDEITLLEEKMDSTSIISSSGDEIILFYEDLLSMALKNGFKTKKDLTLFLISEDKAFRSFLTCLSSLGDRDLKTIRESSEKIMGRIISLIEDEGKVVSSSEGAALLTMRMNRRLIQNSLCCLDDVKHNKVRGDNPLQEKAYAWMIVQPWISFGETSFLLLTEKEKRELMLLAEDTPQAISRLGNPELPVDFGDLAQRLIKIAISNL